MKIREFFINFFNRVKDGISRYFIAFVCSVILFGTLSYDILFRHVTDETIAPLCLSCVLVGLFSILLKNIQEQFTEKLSNLIQIIVNAAVAVAGFVLIKINYESNYMIMAYIGILIALVCFIFFVLMQGGNRNVVFPKLVSSAVFVTAICGVLSVGISLCIWAFESLIFSWSQSYKLYQIINLLIWTVGYVNIFLSFIPKKDVLPPQSKIFKTFVLYAGLPLYILLIAILLVYLAKIVFTWNMPIGEINWFASFASLFFIFFVMSVMQYSEKIAKLFVRYGGYFLIPVLIMQAIAVFERINAYGLTTPRTISLVLIAISILFIGGAIIKPKHLNKIALASGIIVLIVTVTPFNVIDMPVASQTAMLKNALLKNNMIKDNSVVPSETVSEEDKETIRSAYQYLRHNAEQIPDFIPDSDKDFSEIFGFTNYEYESNYRHCSFRTKNSVSIAGYDKLIEIHSYDGDVIHLEHNGQQYDINAKELAQELYDRYGSSQEEMEPYQVNENVAICFKSFQIELQNDEIYYYSLNGYALLK